MLFDSSASHSFIVASVVIELGLEVETLEEPLYVSSPLGIRVRIGMICRGCGLMLYRYKFGLYRYKMSTGAFLALLGFPRLRQLFTHIHSASYWLPGHTSLCTYVLNLKDLHKSKNIEEIRSTYSYAKCG